MASKRAELEGEERTRIGNTPVGADDGQKAQQLLEKVQETQAAFWDMLRELEEETGLELDSTKDYRDVSSVDELD